MPWDYTTYNPAAGVLKCPTVVKLLGHFVGLLKICFCNFLLLIMFLRLLSIRLNGNSALSTDIICVARLSGALKAKLAFTSSSTSTLDSCQLQLF